MTLTEQQQKVFDLAKKAHKGQVRKYTGEPYYNHLINVAEIVHPYDGENMFLVEIALLHDILEDTDMTNPELMIAVYAFDYGLSEAGYIVSCVQQLTDSFTKEAYPDLNRSERKLKEIERLGKNSFKSSQTVKYADLIDNTKSIVEHDRSFAEVYIKEKRQMLENIRNGNLDLFVKCYQSLLEAESKLKHI